MAALPEPMLGLIAALRKLPGIGPRSAERIALHLVQADSALSEHLSAAILAARQKVRLCDHCGALTQTVPCAFCTDSRRDASLICLVERPVDILSIERSGTFRGHYHVLGGRISPTNSIGPEDLRITSLESRLSGGHIQELIIALASDVEGDATSYYLAKRLARPGLRITRIAHGLPAGAGVEFADEITLSRAIEGRRDFS